MKNNIIVTVLMFLSVISLIAQSDYQKVQNFNAKINEIKTSIDTVLVPEKLDSLGWVIDSLKEFYADDKELLDKSLYPDDFTTTFEKLENKLRTYRENFASVGQLKAQIASLQNRLTELNAENTRLLGLVKEYQNVGGSDRASVSELKRLVSDLQSKLKQRDELVRGLVDSLLADFMKHPMTLNDAEKQTLYEKIETGNLFYNIEKTIRDNLEFLKATRLGPDDLGEIKEDQVQFYNMWKKIGPKLADVYMDKGEKAGEVAYITNLFAQWNQNVDQEIWTNVRNILRESNIKTEPFTNGEEFTNNLLKYISDSKASGTKADYEYFEDSVWTEKLRASWLPILVDNEMLTVDQRDSLRSAVDDWGDMYDEDTPVYWYIAIVIIIVIFFLIFGPKWKKKGKPLAEQ